MAFKKISLTIRMKFFQSYFYCSCTIYWAEGNRLYL